MQRIVHTPLPQQPGPVVHLAPIASGAGIDRLNRTVRHDGRGSAQAVDFDPAEPGAQEPGVGQVCAAQVGIAQECELEIHTAQCCTGEGAVEEMSAAVIGTGQVGIVKPGTLKAGLHQRHAAQGRMVEGQIAAILDVQERALQQGA